MSNETSTDYSLRLDDSAVRRYAAMSAREAVSPAWGRFALPSSARILDLGCGPGTMLPFLVDKAGVGGRVIGVDRDSDAVAAAQALVGDSGWGNVEVVQADVGATGLDIDSFDLVHIRLVLTHLGSRVVPTLAHISSLLRPGGYVLATDGDLTGARSSLPRDPHLDRLRSAYLDYQAASGNDVTTGPHLPQYLTAAGFEVVGVDVAAVTHRPEQPMASIGPWEARETLVERGFLTQADITAAQPAVERFLAGREEWSFHFFYSAVGRKPANA